MRMRDVFADLVLGGQLRRVRPTRAAAVSTLRGDVADLAPTPAWPSPAPAGMVTPWSAAAYDGLTRSMVVAHKERRVLALRRPARPGCSPPAAAAAAPRGVPVVLVPVPSRPGSARARGHDPTDALTRDAARLLRRQGYDARRVRLLVSRGAVADQAGLDATAPGRQPGGLDVLPDRPPAPDRGPTGARRGVRRRADDRARPHVRPSGPSRRWGSRSSAIATVAATRLRRPRSSARRES